MITLDNWQFEILTEFRDGFNEEALLARYSDVLLKYDYILGDWGYGQLRLKGFFDDTNQKATYETKISTLQDYLYEYCNFGCAYFVLKKTGRIKPETQAMPEIQPNVETE
ncbi:MAG: YutD-like domain-containing protein [Sporosarcina sp.]